MGFLAKLFAMKPKEPQKSAEPQSHQLPSDIVCPEFGEVNVRRTGNSTEILFTILMEPQGAEAEGWQTGVALDASGSMQGVYGKGLVDRGRGEDAPQSLLKGYADKGWLRFVKHKGQNVPVLSDAAKTDLVNRGYYQWSKKEIEPLARRMTGYLASNLDEDGGTTVVYWACGDGSEIEVLGDLTAEDCEKACFGGPSKVKFGEGTRLTPAMKYFVDRFEDAKRGMYIFITDGQLHDLEEVKQYTTKLARNIEAGNRNPVKCVLVGIGDDIDERQMEELDDLDTGTTVDIWDHKIAKEMRALIEIFAEVVNENQIVAPTATIYDENGKIVAKFTDGLPAKVKFIMPSHANAFELEVAGRRIRQTLVAMKT